MISHMLNIVQLPLCQCVLTETGPNTAALLVFICPVNSAYVELMLPLTRKLASLLMQSALCTRLQLPSKSTSGLNQNVTVNCVVQRSLNQLRMNGTCNKGERYTFLTIFLANPTRALCFELFTQKISSSTCYFTVSMVHQTNQERNYARFIIAFTFCSRKRRHGNPQKSEISLY